MHPVTLDIYEDIKRRNPSHPVLKSLDSCVQHFYIPRSLFEVAIAACRQAAMESAETGDAMTVPDTARLPGDVVCIVTDGSDGLDVNLLERVVGPNNAPHFFQITALVRGKDPTPLAKVSPGHKSMHSDHQLSKSEHKFKGMNGSEVLFAVCFTTCMQVSLINTPRIVARHTETVSRQFRKKVLAITGQPSVGYVRVAWQVGGKTRPKQGVADKHHGVALHWCRAHFAVAEEGQPKAEWLNVPIRGWGWWRWVADSWKGHPDFGIKFHSYVPHLEDRCPQIAKFPTFTASSADRLAYLDAAKVQALRAAGFAA